MPRKGKDFFIDLKAEALKRGIQDVSAEMIAEVQEAVKNTAHAAYASIVADAQRKLNKTRNAFLSGLNFETLSKDNYIIYLDGPWPNAIEDGWAPYNMKEGMLRSKKTVTEGSRAGMPWVQKGKKGQRYAHVPFEQSASKSAAGASDLSGILKNLKVHNAKTGLKQKITSTFKDFGGKVMQGKVATYRSSPEDIKKGMFIPNLEGITKYQKIVKDKAGREKVKSVFLTFRTVSDLSPANAWWNKGYAGLHSFQDAEKYVESELQNILDTVLR